VSTSESIRVSFPDGTSAQVPTGTTVLQALLRWPRGDPGSALAALVDGTPVDLTHPLSAPAAISPLTFDDPAGREIAQHSAAHLVAKAVVEAIPGALPTVGPAEPDGFYYDFDVRPLTPHDLESIERAIDAEVRAAERFERLEVSKAEALRMAATNPYKQGYLADVAETDRVSFYRTGSFVDLCRGPHVADSSRIQGVKILGFSGITAGGLPDGKPLQRIRGVAFPSKARLDEYLRLRGEAEARDHRVIGQRLELFSFVEESPGFPFLWPNGMVVVRELERFVLEHLEKAGYSEIRSPLLFAQSIYETSGHWEHYRSNMFLTQIDDRAFGVKPMNCPGSMLIFQSRARSYRELPLRLAEFAPLHRLEPSGTLHGLFRVREFVQDDAHLFVSDDQVEAEVRGLLELVKGMLEPFRLRWTYELSTRPTPFMGDAETWDRAEATLKQLLDGSGIEYKIHAGEGAFYGPKIDIHLHDSLGRPWQTGTIQLDYQMPRRFRLEYQGADGKLHVPVVIHRTILGSMERFLGIVLEHTNGRLPPWLAPIQVRVLPVTDRHAAASSDFLAELRARRIRAEASESVDTLGKRVRRAEVDRIPYIAVLGDAEAAAGTVALRKRGTKAPEVLPRAEAVNWIADRVAQRSFDP